MNTTELRRQLDEARTNRERLFGEIENLKARADADDEGIAQRIADTNRAVEKTDGRIQDLEAEYGRYSYIERQSQDSRNFDGYQADLEEQQNRGRDPRNETRDQALRTLERVAGVMDAGRPEEIETLVRQPNRDGDLTSRYLAAAGDPAYRTAFIKMMSDPQSGHLRFSPQEVEAVRKVSAVDAERAMSVGSGAGGGFSIPIEIDPSIILSSSGAANPVRRLATVRSMISNELRLVTSDGVTVSYSAEGAAMVDGTPTLVQPVIQAKRWTAFVPYSWELAQDWGSLQSELVRVIADGRDANDSAMFATGSTTSNQPTGLFTGLSSTQAVLTVGTAALAAGDLWALKAAIPPRFQSGGAIAAPSPQLDRIYRLVGNGATAEASLFAGNDRSGNLVGLPTAEWSFNAGTATGTGGTIAVAGDFSQYVIGDRLGLSAVSIPALFNGNTAGGIGYPTGQSGLAVWGRTGAAVAVPGAFRVLVGR